MTRDDKKFCGVLGIILIISWLFLNYLPFDNSLKSNLKAYIIGLGFTVLIIVPLLRFFYPPMSKTLTKFVIPQLNLCLFGYVCQLGFLLKYQFDNSGFKGMGVIDLSTHGIFLKKNLSGLKAQLERRKDTVYSIEELKEMNDMFRSFHNNVDQFITRYGNCLNEGVLSLLYEVRHICWYQIFYTSIPSEIEDKSPIHMGENISNEPMKKVLSLVELITGQIEKGTVLKVEPVAV